MPRVTKEEENRAVPPAPEAEPVSTVEQGRAQRNEEQLLARADSDQERERLARQVIADSVDSVDPSPAPLPPGVPEGTVTDAAGAARYVIAHNAVDNWYQGETVERAALGDRVQRLLDLGAIRPVLE